MKAVVYDGRTDSLVQKEIEKPIPGDHEVLVKIFSVSVNAADYRSIQMRIVPKRKIFGADIAGRVEVVGKMPICLQSEMRCLEILLPSVLEALRNMLLFQKLHWL